MKCPYCGLLENKVIDSRLSKNTLSIRRRRECLVCKNRFTTHEHIVQIPLVIVKKDGRREQFNKDKLRNGINKACEKRDISVNAIEDVLVKVEKELREFEKKEVQSSKIGEIVMSLLHELDGVAYVRFASVYREFKDVKQFVNELEQYIDEKNYSSISV